MPSSAVNRARLRGITAESPCYLIFTSGTTGLPKAGVITHFRGYGAGASFASIFGVTHDDHIYTTLPLYHR